MYEQFLVVKNLWMDLYKVILMVFIPDFYLQAATSSQPDCPDDPRHKFCGDNWKTYRSYCHFQKRNVTGVKQLFEGSCRSCNSRERAHTLLMKYFFNENGACRIKYGAPSKRNNEKCLQKLFTLFSRSTQYYEYKYITYKEFSSVFQRYETSTRRSFRRCLRTLAKFCDVDRDRYVSGEEFVQCFAKKDDKKMTVQSDERSKVAIRCIKNICYCFAYDGNVIVHFRKENQEKYDCMKVRKNWNKRHKLKEQCNEDSRQNVKDRYMKC